MSAGLARLRPTLPIVSAVAVGGSLGAVARYAIGEVWEYGPRGFPWPILIVNVTGCLLIGVLMVLIEEEVSRHRLVRPFFGVGLLGGYTTFSPYALDVERLAVADSELTAAAYAAATLTGALVAVAAGIIATSGWLRYRRRAR